MNGNDLILALAIFGVALFGAAILYVYYRYWIPLVFLACLVALFILMMPEKEKENERETSVHHSNGRDKGTDKTNQGMESDKPGF